ncbi:helix-turn-helix domain-containing protein [Bdellovibrio sp. HCB337]|uniref:helix-turn-helix domain-containing protein n=1 Tax=Bdellovibrio sp. HCB337 TaxID=3394358 RepID=UPI0039A53C01
MRLDMFFPNQNRHVRFLMGLYLNRKRNEQGLSLQEVASQVGLTPQSYKRIESGGKKIDDTLFEKIQSLIAIEPEDLNEIRRIAAIRFVNDLSKAFASNYPL